MCQYQSYHGPVSRTGSDAVVADAPRFWAEFLGHDPRQADQLVFLNDMGSAVSIFDKSGDAGGVDNRCSDAIPQARRRLTQEADHAKKVDFQHSSLIRNGDVFERFDVESDLHDAYQIGASIMRLMSSNCSIALLSGRSFTTGIYHSCNRRIIGRLSVKGLRRGHTCRYLPKRPWPLTAKSLAVTVSDISVEVGRRCCFYTHLSMWFPYLAASLFVVSQTVSYRSIAIFQGYI